MSVYPESNVVHPPAPNMYPAPVSTTVILQQPQSANPGKLVCSRDGHRGWSSGMFGCAEDVKSCLCVICCQEFILAEMSSRTGENICVTCCVPGGLLALRTRIRTLGGIQGSICEDYLSLWCCYLCTLCQMHRELGYMGL